MTNLPKKEKNLPNKQEDGRRRSKKQMAVSVWDIPDEYGDNIVRENYLHKEIYRDNTELKSWMLIRLCIQVSSVFLIGNWLC